MDSDAHTTGKGPVANLTARRLAGQVQADSVQEKIVLRLQVVHDQLEGAPKTAASVSGVGWMRVLSGLKTLVETGKPLQG